MNENNALTMVIIARNQYNKSSDRVIAKELTNHSTDICNHYLHDILNNMTVFLVDWYTMIGIIQMVVNQSSYNTF